MYTIKDYIILISLILTYIIINLIIHYAFYNSLVF